MLIFDVARTTSCSLEFDATTTAASTDCEQGQLRKLDTTQSATVFFAPFANESLLASSCAVVLTLSIVDALDHYFSYNAIVDQTNGVVFVQTPRDTDAIDDDVAVPAPAEITVQLFRGFAQCCGVC